MTSKTLTDLHKKHQGKVSDKWAFYLDQYDRLFNPLRDKAISLFEIGIQNGGSLEVWSKYFPRAKVFVGCDIDQKCSELTYQDPRINLVIGDANQPKIQKEVIQTGGPFDIVIDDGSHRSGDIIKSFVNYFPHLADNGLYVIEDLHCSFWEDFEGGLFAPYSSMTFFKQLTDLINYEHWGVSKGFTEILKGFSVQYDLKLKQDVLEKIESIEFLNSMCVIRKSSGKTPELGLRVVNGKDAAISNHIKLDSTKSIPPSQINNIFSERKLPPAEEVIDLYKKIQTQETKIQTQENSLNQIINSRSWKITRPLRFIKNKFGVLALFLKYENYIKFFDLLFKHGFLSTFRLIKSKTSLKANSNFTYDQWIKAYDCFNDNDKELLKKQIKKFKSKPLISIVMPTYNSNVAWLKSAIESVQNQIYHNWELCIADDASTDKNVIKILKKYSKNDLRIKVVFREKNGHISESSNTALSITTGHWVAFLDHDDLLSETALFYVAKYISENPNAGLIYSDEDKLDEKGNRFDPYFKPDWNPDLFLSHNLICHLSVYKKSLVLRAGGFRVGYEGAQDYDLALRVSKFLSVDQIGHIPRILYHWRSHRGSTALSGKEKVYALEAGVKALNDHLKSSQIDGKAELTDFGMYRVRYELPSSQPLVSLIIPTRNGYSILKKCIDSIVNKTTYKTYEILVIDNGSDDSATLEYLANINRLKNVKVLRDDGPFNYSALNNNAVRNCKSDFIALINNDVEVITPEWLSEMVSLAIQPGVGCVGARLWYPNDTLQHGGVILGLGGVAGHSHKYLPKGHPGHFGRARLIQNFSAVTAACLLVRRKIYDEVGGFDEVNLTVAFNDVDFCLKILEKGYRNVWTPYAELYHHESISRGLEDSPKKIARFQSEINFIKEKWGSRLLVDPAYSPNLTLDAENFTIAWPPRVAS